MKRHVKAVLLSGALVVMPCQAIAAAAEPPGPQQLSASLPTSPGQAGRWIADGRLVVAVVNEATAAEVRAAGAVPQRVTRSQGELDRLFAQVDKIARTQRGLQSWGIDPVANKVVVKARGGYGAFAGLGDGVQVVRTTTDFRQQAGEVNPGDPWWPGGESNCSVGFPVTDAQGSQHFLTAGHCTNDASQAAYGASGQANRIGTSNVGGSRSVNAREGDMGVVAVTESGWTISPNVNTWGQPAVTVTGSADALVGETVCHSGNTAPNWECGKVTAVNQTIDYGNVVIDGLTTTTACSQGGDSGGAWLRGDKAVGLHSGGNSTCTPNEDNSIFQPVGEALTKWNLTLLTDKPPVDDDEAPTTPGSPRSTGSTSSEISLAWDASTDNIGVTGYDVLDGTRVVASAGSAAATVTGLAADTSYTFTLVAKDAAGNKSAASPAVTARTQPGGTRTFANGTDYPIRDFQVAVSPVRSTASGRTTCHPMPATKTYDVPVDETASGTWTLRVGDNGYSDTGTLTSWSITL